MLACQGEGPDLDARRPRHPMWELLFSHPAPPGAIFLAEMIAPVAANPIYITAPLFPGLIYGWPMAGNAASPPLSWSAFRWRSRSPASAGRWKSAFCCGFRRASRGRDSRPDGLVRLRLDDRLPHIAGVVSKFGAPLAALLAPLAALPWPPVRALAGHGLDGSHAFWRGVAICDAISLGLIAAAVVSATASARRGLAGTFSLAAPAPRANADRRSRFGREPLYRKEWLWFRATAARWFRSCWCRCRWRRCNSSICAGDRRRGVAWNYLCGIGILFGTYFLLILGPKSLASEGPRCGSR